MTFEIQDIEFISYGGYHSAYVVYSVGLSEQTYRDLYDRAGIQSASYMTYDELVAENDSEIEVTVAIHENYDVEINLFFYYDGASQTCAFGNRFYSFRDHEESSIADSDKHKLKLSDEEKNMVIDKVRAALKERDCDLEADLSEAVEELNEELGEEEFFMDEWKGTML